MLSFGGNPETLTPENIARLKELEVKSYQLSLDGLEAAHDAQRRPGSSATPWRASKSWLRRASGWG